MKKPVNKRVETYEEKMSFNLIHLVSIREFKVLDRYDLSTTPSAFRESNFHLFPLEWLLNLPFCLELFKFLHGRNSIEIADKHNEKQIKILP